MRVLACDRIHRDGLAKLCETGFEMVVIDSIKYPAVPADASCARPAIPNIEMP